MRKDLIKGPKRTDEHCIKFSAHNISLKDIKASPHHLGDSKAYTNHTVEKPDLP